MNSGDVQNLRDLEQVVGMNEWRLALVVADLSQWVSGLRDGITTGVGVCASYLGWLGGSHLYFYFANFGM